MDDGAPRTPDYVVTLVHGTFARRAAWTQDGSTLRALIRDRLKDGSVQFECFLWSGLNTDRARQKAAGGLRRTLGRRLLEYPRARHYVVAHSHGGNVALHALQGFEHCGRIAGVICFASPFIHCEARDVRKSVKALRSSALILWSIACWSLATWTGLPAWLIWLAGVGELWFLLFRREGAFERWATQRQEAVLRDYRPSGEVAAPFLCVHATRDEAGRILGLTGLVSETPYRLDRVLEVLDVVVKWAVRLLFGATVLFGLFAKFHEGWLDGWNLTTEGMVAAAGVLLTIATFALRIGLRTLRVPIEMAKLALPFGLRRLTFGSTGLVSYWLARFWTEPRPYGVKTLTLKPYVLRVPFFSIRRQLRHSFIYTDKAVLEDVIAWLLALSTAPAPAARQDA